MRDGVGMDGAGAVVLDNCGEYICQGSKYWDKYSDEGVGGRGSKGFVVSVSRRGAGGAQFCSFGVDVEVVRLV